MADRSKRAILVLAAITQVGTQNGGKSTGVRVMGAKTWMCMCGLLVLVSLGEPALAADLPTAAEWDSMGIEELAQDAVRLNSAGLNDDKRRLAQTIVNRYDADLTVDLSNCSSWLELSTHIGRYLPGTTRRKLARALAHTMAPDKGSVVRLEAEAAAKLATALFELGSQSEGRFVGASWLNGALELSSASVEALAELARSLRREEAEEQRARARLAQHITETCIRDVAGMREVPCLSWLRLAHRLKDLLAPAAKQSWVRAIRSAFLTGNGDQVSSDGTGFVYLYLALATLGDTFAQTEARQWMDKSPVWRSFGGQDLIVLAELLHMSGNAADPHMARLKDHVMAERLTDKSVIRRLTPGQWWELDYYLRKGLKSTKYWKFEVPLAKEVREAFAPDAMGFEGLSEREQLDVLNLLITCDEREATQLIDQFASGDSLESADVRSLAAVAYACSRLKMDVLGRRIAEHVTDSYVKGGQRAVSASPSVWCKLANTLPLNPEVQLLWRHHLLRICAGTAQAWNGIDPRVAEPALDAFRALGGPKLASWLEAERRHYSQHAEVVFDSESLSRLWADSVRLQFMRVVAAPSKERRAVWKQLIGECKEHGIRLELSLLPETDAFVRQVGDGNLPKRTILGDLLGLSADRDTESELRMRLLELGLADKITGTSGDLGEKLELAWSLIGEGRVKEATPICSAIAADHPEQPAAVASLRRLALWRLFRREELDAALAETLIRDLASGSGPSGDLACFALRLLIGRVAAVATSERQRTWTEGIKKIGGEDIWFSRGLLADLDKFCLSVSDGQATLAQEMLADLVLLAPELQSMRQIQRRRVRAFVGAMAWGQAKAAARLALVLAAMSADGPFEEARRLSGIFDTGSLPEKERVQCRRLLIDFSLPAVPSDQPGKPEGSSAGALSAVDSVLRENASTLLAQHGDQCTPRRVAFLRLFAGEANAAIQAFHDLLVESPTGTGQASGALNDLCMAVAVADGHYRSGWRFVRRLAQGAAKTEKLNSNSNNNTVLPTGAENQPSSRSLSAEQRPLGRELLPRGLPAQFRSLAREALSAYTARCVRWGGFCLGTKNEGSASAFWAEAVNLAIDSDEADGTADAIFESANGANDPAAALLATARGLTDRAAGSSFLLRLAGSFYEQSDFVRCLEALGQASTSTGSQDENKEMAVGLMRIMCLINLGRLDEASATSVRVSRRQGTDEELARVLFLSGWIRMRMGNMADAMPAFEQVVADYPGTVSAARASSILRRVKTLEQQTVGQVE